MMATSDDDELRAAAARIDRAADIGREAGRDLNQMKTVLDLAGMSLGFQELLADLRASRRLPRSGERSTPVAGPEVKARR